jgi:hypothetical protein
MPFLLLLLDAFILYVILKVALRGNAPNWPKLGALCVVTAVWKWALFLWMGVLAIVPVLLTIGLVVRLSFTITTRKTLYVLAAFVVIRIAFGSILKMALGVVELFFV